MKKFIVKKENDEKLGPLSESDVVNYMSSDKFDDSDLIQELPDGNWISITELDVDKNQDDTFIKKIDSLSEVEEPVKDREEFPKEFEFEKKEIEIPAELEKTVVKKNPLLSSTDLDKTVINADSRRLLEELNKKKKEQELQKEAEIENQQRIEEEKIDLKNDKTQVINLEKLKSTLADEATENEIKLEAEIQERLVVKNKNNKKTKDSLVNKKDEKSKKRNKKFLYIIFLLFGIYLFMDDSDAPVEEKKIEIVNPQISFPQQFEVINSKKASKYLAEGIELLKTPTYINKVKAANRFRLSTEHMFENNKAMAYLIRTYSELLPNSNTPIKDSSKIFKLIQINKPKSISDPLYAEAIASYYLFAKKPQAAQKIIESFNSLKGNRPSTNLFSLYLDILRINGDVSKANKVFERLTSVKNLSFKVSVSLLNYYNFVGDEQNYKKLLTETYKRFPFSANLLLKSVRILIDESRFEVIPKVLVKVKKLQAEKSKEYYSKYLEYLGILKVHQKKFKVANNFFKEALTYNESSELRSRLANLDFSGDSISDLLIAESKAIKLIERSKKHRKNRNLKSAFSDALEATRIAQDYIPAKLHLADLQIQNGLFKEAIDSLEGMQKRNITDPEITFTLIDAYIESYKFNDVKKLLSIISSSNLADDYRYYTSTAKYYVYKEDFYNSVNWLQLAIRKNPLDESMHFELAKILSRYRKYQKAKVFLSKLIDLNPVELKYRVAYSHILYESEGITYAVGYLYDILQDYPNNAQLLSAIGIYYYKSGQQKKYEQIKDQLAQLPKKDSSLYKFLIESALLDNDKKLLIDNLKKLIELEPGNLAMRILLGKTYLAEENFKDALFQFKKVESRLDTYPRLQYFMSKLYLLTDNIPKAIELAKSEIKSNPQNIEGYVLLGDIYNKEKKYNQAEEMYKKAQRIDEKDIDTLIGLSSINLKKSQFDIAIDLLLKARSVNPNNSNVHKLLGDAYRKIGQSSLATESYKIFLELSPNSRYKDEISTYLRIMQ